MLSAFVLFMLSILPLSSFISAFILLMAFVLSVTTWSALFFAVVSDCSRASGSLSPISFLIACFLASSSTLALLSAFVASDRFFSFSDCCSLRFVVFPFSMCRAVEQLVCFFSASLICCSLSALNFLTSFSAFSFSLRRRFTSMSTLLYSFKALPALVAFCSIEGFSFSRLSDSNGQSVC